MATKVDGSLFQPPRKVTIVESIVDQIVEQIQQGIWRNPPAEAVQAGHGGGDYFVAMDFVDAIRGRKPVPIGIHEAMDMTVPGLISQQSILHGGAWLDVPDTRLWRGTA